MNYYYNVCLPSGGEVIRKETEKTARLLANKITGARIVGRDENGRGWKLPDLRTKKGERK